MGQILDSYLTKRAELDEQMKKHGKTLLKELFEDFWEKNPDCKVVSWTQYAPHFNDGDACVFSVNDMYMWAVSKEKLDELGISDEYDVDADQPAHANVQYEPKGEGQKAWRELVRNVPKLEDLFEETFGDGYKVFATRRGFSTEEYEHD